MNKNLDITGNYRHYKGNESEVIGEGVHTETEEKLVIYKSISAPYTIWVRPFDMFFDDVLINDKKLPRFTKTISIAQS